MTAVEAPAPLPELDAARLEGVSRLWRDAGRQLVARFGGTSMLPTIRPGQPVCIGCGDDFAQGDVVVFQRGEQLIVHRVLLLRRAKGYMVTGGDALVFPDPVVTDLSSVIGRLRGLHDEGVSRPLPPAPHSPARHVALALWRLALLPGPTIGRRLTVLFTATRRRALAVAHRLFGSQSR